MATAKRDLVPGDVLDGEGGYTVWGKRMPARKSLEFGGLPLGLAHGVKVVRAAPRGQVFSGGTVSKAVPAAMSSRPSATP